MSAEPIKEKVTIIGEQNNKTVSFVPAEPIAISPNRLDIFYRNVNGDGILINLGVKNTASFSDWVTAEEYYDLLNVISTNSTFTIRIYASYDGETYLLSRELKSYRCASLRARRFLLQYSFDIEFEEL